MGVLVMPEHIHAALNDYTELLGVDAGKYWLDPRMAPPPAQEGPDPQLMVQMQAVEAQRQRNDVDLQKAQLGAQIDQIGRTM